MNPGAKFSITEQNSALRRDSGQAEYNVCVKGFDDKAILQITLIASWFNYINRVVDALGVGREA